MVFIHKVKFINNYPALISLIDCDMSQKTVVITDI